MRPLLTATLLTTVTNATAIAIPIAFLFSPSAIASCVFFSAPQRYNTQTIDDVIVVGEQRDRPYKVVVIGADETTTLRLQACILDAFTTRSNFGPYIRAGSFERRRDAEDLRRILQREGYNARVTYQRE